MDLGGSEDRKREIGLLFLRWGSSAGKLLHQARDQQRVDRGKRGSVVEVEVASDADGGKLLKLTAAQTGRRRKIRPHLHHRTFRCPGGRPGATAANSEPHLP